MKKYVHVVMYMTPLLAIRTAASNPALLLRISRRIGYAPSVV